MSSPTDNNSTNSHDTQHSDEQLRKHRIRREIIRVENEEVEQSEEDETKAEGTEKSCDSAESATGEEEQEDNGSKSLWRHILTGGFITSDGALQYYRYLIAIAVMCFISIFLTFMSLNADSEFRRKEKMVAVLRERAVLKSEERHRISSRDEVVRMLKEWDNIEMIDQNNSQRM